MMQKLTNKLLAPHRKEGLQDESSPHDHHHHEHHEHHHDHHDHHDHSSIKPAVIVQPVVPVVPAQPTVTVVDEGIVTRETVVKPVIVDEKVRTDTIVEIQPIVHREIEQPVVHHIDQHVVEPTPVFVGGTITNKPIINEHVSTNTVEEIQPIVHREIAVPKVHKVEEHINEHQVAPTQHTHTVTETAGLAAEVVHEKNTKVLPSIVDEKVRVDKVVEVQPVIHRNIDRTVVHHVEQHIVEPAAPFVGGTVEKKAIIDEHVQTRAVDEIQPIVHRELAVPKVEKVEEHVNEKIVAPTQHTHEKKTMEGHASDIVHGKGKIVKPEIVDEKERQDTITEIQPIVHRTIEQPVVHHIEEHIQEPAAPFVGGSYTNQPIVDEHIKTRVVDEIQPVVHKEIAVAKVEKKEAHVSEHIVAPTEHTHEERKLAGHTSDIKAAAGAIVKPEIVKEKVRQDTVVEVQPVVHREIEQPVVRHVEQHIVEPTPASLSTNIRNPTIVDEKLNTVVIDEVQPVVHREVAVPKVEKVEDHTTQQIVAPTEHTYEVKETVKSATAVPTTAKSAM